MSQVPLNLTEQLPCQTFPRLVQYQDRHLYNGLGTLLLNSAFELDINRDMQLTEYMFADPMFEVDENSDIQPREIYWQFDHSTGDMSPTLI